MRSQGSMAVSCCTQMAAFEDGHAELPDYMGDNLTAVYRLLSVVYEKA